MEANSRMDETFEFSFSSKRNAEKSGKITPDFPLGEPLLHLLFIHLKRECCTVERQKFYICNRGDCFVCTTWF